MSGKKTYIYLAIIFLGLSAFGIQKAVKVKEIPLCHTENNAFQADEKLVYKLYYNWQFVWIPAGEVVFRVKENESDYELSAFGKTYSSYDNFFKVRDYFYSRVDKETLLPIEFKRDIVEGKYRLFDSISFDQANYKAEAIHGKTRETAESYDFEFDECMQDMLSILYLFRNIDYTDVDKGSRIPVKLFFDKELFPLDLEFMGIEKKKKIKGMGKYRAMKFMPEVVAGEVFDENTKMSIWVSDDQNKVPLLIESPVSVGSVKAVLKKHTGLKYPLEGKVK